MARKSVTDDFQIFSERLSSLMKEQGITQQSLADSLGIKRQTVSLYKSGQSMPDARTLRDLALYFKVSSDYLLGISDIRSTDIDLKEISEKTGLSEHLVNRILKTKNSAINEDGDFFRFLDELFNTPQSMFTYMLWDMFNYRNALEAGYSICKLKDRLLDEELKKMGCKEGDPREDILVEKALDIVDAKSVEEIKKMYASPKYSSHVKKMITAESFIYAELACKDNTFRAAIGGIPEDLLPGIYKNNIISALMIELNRLDDQFNYMRTPDSLK